MDIEIRVTAGDVKELRTFYKQWKENPFVLRRRERNAVGKHAPIRKATFWEALLSALLTTQQRSGPTSPVSQFIGLRPFPLKLDRCRKNRSSSFIEKEISRFGGIRRGPTIAEQGSKNLMWLEDGGWTTVLTALKALSRNSTVRRERETARLLAKELSGIGPKQSRNLLQMLGLTRYEIPLDSRITKWLNDFGFPIQLNPTLLSDEAYYEFVSDAFQKLCKKAGILPCLADAAIFASYDGDSWSEKNVKW